MFRPTIIAGMLSTLFVFSLNSRTVAADVDFTKQVLPIFMENCAGCHGEKKGLGGLRLNTPEGIQAKAEKDEELIVKGKPDESELIKRLELPADHKKFMPKKGKPLPKEKLSLIRQWIEQGAVYTVAAAKPEVEAPAEGEAKPMEKEAAPAAAPKELPLPEVGAADKAAVEKIAASGGQVTSLYAGSPLLQVSYALRSEPATDAELTLLADVADQVYALNLAKAQVSDKGLAELAKLKNLSQLHLENSSVTDSGLSYLSGLDRLQYLNLYGTVITDEGVKHLEGLKHLQKLYVWKTPVSYDKAQAMEKATPGLMVDLGFDHPVVARKRVTKQLEQAKAQATESEAALKKAKETLDQVTKDQEAAKKKLEEAQKQLDILDGKVKPEEPKKEEAKAEEKK